MKFSKLVLSTALAVGFVMSVFDSPANARRRTPVDTTSMNEVLKLQFDVVDETRTGVVIGNCPLMVMNNTCLFKGAIDNFTALFDNPAPLNPPGPTTRVPNISETRDLLAQKDVNNSVVRYSFLNSSDLSIFDELNAELGIIFIDDFDPITIESNSLNFSELDQATNDLSYIRNNLGNLFQFDEPVTGFFPANIGEDVEEILPKKTVPEPATTLSLFALGSFGIGSWLKSRKDKASSKIS